MPSLHGCKAVASLKVGLEQVDAATRARLHGCKAVASLKV